MSISEFMTGEYKVQDKRRKKKRAKKIVSVASSVTIPFLLTGSVGAVGLAIAGTKALASMKSTVIPVDTTTAMAQGEAITANASEWMGEKTLSTLAHVLDPVVDILVALSFPVASVIIVGACFYFMFDKSEKAWGMITNAGLGYILIQVSPLILSVLKQVGTAV